MQEHVHYPALFPIYGSSSLEVTTGICESFFCIFLSRICPSYACTQLCLVPGSFFVFLCSLCISQDPLRVNNQVVNYRNTCLSGIMDKNEPMSFLAWVE